MSGDGGDADRRKPAPINREFAWHWVWAALVLAAVAGAIVGYLLWGKTTADHKDAFDTAWKSSAAVLAILATIISVERFRLSQREHHRQLEVDRFSRADAIARQITDLSAKASEQLGSDKAVVRIGGLTDLERLAQANPELRQTVVDRICAYLRGPYEPVYGPTPPDPYADDDDDEQPAPPDLTAEESAARRLELDVRRIAQQILKRHLHWPGDAPDPPPRFWAGIDLDLRDALLIEFDLAHCRVNRADFQNARFHTRPDFSGAIFVADAQFSGAAFAGDAKFDGTVFSGFTLFIETRFSEDASFIGAAFTQVRFIDTTFSRLALFDRATIGEAGFFGTVFSGPAHFGEAVFPDGAAFQRALFANDAGFAQAAFSGDTSFKATTFAEAAVFYQAVFAGAADFTDARFESTAPGLNFLNGPQFDYTLIFDGARVLRPDAGHSFPPPWRIEPNPAAGDGSGHLVRPPVKKSRK